MKQLVYDGRQDQRRHQLYQMQRIQIERRTQKHQKVSRILIMMIIMMIYITSNENQPFVAIPKTVYIVG